VRKGFFAAQLTVDREDLLAGPFGSIFASKVSARVKWQSIDNLCPVIAALLVCHSKYQLPFHLDPLPVQKSFVSSFFGLCPIISKNLWCSTYKGKSKIQKPKKREMKGAEN